MEIIRKCKINCLSLLCTSGLEYIKHKQKFIMKKLLVLIAGVLLSVSSYGQLSTAGNSKEIGRYSGIMNPSQSADLVSYEINNQTEYKWSYVNMENPDGKDFVRTFIKFKGDAKLINDLYLVLKDQLKDENRNKKYNLTLGETDLEIVGMRLLGANQLSIRTKNSWFFMSEKQLNKLFGIKI